MEWCITLIHGPRRHRLHEVGRLQTNSVFGQVDRRSLPPGWLCSSQKRGMSSQILARRHTQIHTVQSFGFVTYVTNKYTRNKPQSDVTTHTAHTSEMHTDKPARIQSWLEMHHSYTHTKRNNNAKHRQHNSPAQTNYHPPTHKQQSTKGQNIVIFQININGIKNKIEELNKPRTQNPTGHHHNTRNKTHTESLTTTWTRITHQRVQHINKQQHHPSYMETSKHHANPKTKQGHEHRHIIQTHLSSLSDSKNTGEDTTPIYHKQHPTHLHATWLQKQPLYKHSTTQHKQQHRNKLQPNQTIRTHNHSSTGHEQSIRHSKHTHTHT